MFLRAGGWRRAAEAANKEAAILDDLTLFRPVQKSSQVFFKSSKWFCGTAVVVEAPCKNENRRVSVLGCARERTAKGIEEPVEV